MGWLRSFRARDDRERYPAPYLLARLQQIHSLALQQIQFQDELPTLVLVFFRYRPLLSGFFQIVGYWLSFCRKPMGTANSLYPQSTLLFPPQSSMCEITSNFFSQNFVCEKARCLPVPRQFRYHPPTRFCRVECCLTNNLCTTVIPQEILSTPFDRIPQHSPYPLRAACCALSPAPPSHLPTSPPSHLPTFPPSLPPSSPGHPSRQSPRRAARNASVDPCWQRVASPRIGLS